MGSDGEEEGLERSIIDEMRFAFATHSLHSWMELGCYGVERACVALALQDIEKQIALERHRQKTIFSQ